MADKLIILKDASANNLYPKVQGSSIPAKAVGKEKLADAVVSDINSKVPKSTTVNGHALTGNVTVTKADVGLGNVDNTADAAKSVKYAINAGSANAVAWGNVSGKPSSFNASAHTHDSITVNEADTSTFNSPYHDFQALYAGESNNIEGKPSDVDAFGLLRFRVASGWSGQMLLADGGDLYIRSAVDGSFNKSLPWKRIIDSGNIGAQAVNYATSAGSVAWGNVSGRPSSMPASDVYPWAKASSKPSYNWSEINGRPSSLPASDVYAWAKASSKPSYNWNEIGSKPSTFTPSAHNHDDRYVRAIGTSNDNIDSDWGQSFKTFDPIPSGTPPEQNPNISLLSIDEDFNRRKQLAFTYSNDNIYYRRHVDGAFTNWKRIAFASEIPTTLPANGGNADTVDGVHIDWSTNYTASDYLAIWDNDGKHIRPIPKGSTSVGYATIAGSANSVAWNNVSGKPSTYPPSSHTHSYLPLSGGTITGNIVFSDSGTAFRGIQGTVGGNDAWRVVGGATAGNAGFLEIATADDGTEPIYVRQYTGVFSNVARTATLLDDGGNTSFPGSLSIGGSIYEGGLALSNKYATKAELSSKITYVEI